MRGLFAAFILLAGASLVHSAEWTVQAVPPAEPPGGGPHWYRCYVQVPDRLVKSDGSERDLWRSSMVLAVADLPGPFEIILNGQRIARSDGLAPGKERRFKVPKDILQKGSYNALTFRLEGASATRGLTVAPVFIDYFNELVFANPWEMTSEKPGSSELSARAEKPASAVYTADQFRLSSRALAPIVQPIPGRKVAPDVALKLLVADDDLAVEAVLSEPEVAQPTQVSFDTRGRMWIAQYRQYPFPAGVKMIGRDQYYRSKYDRLPPAPPNHDRGADIISVHEDADGDGVYESSKKVLEGLNMANSVVRGWGGIWVMHTPYLLFYPDADGDDIPDDDPEVRLAGFGLEDTHSVANGLAWGPDGWLYGAHGSTTTSRVTRPGEDSSEAPGIYNEGPIVWRYHPKTRDFEVFADGGGNTFGLSFDAEGRLFSGHNGGNTRGFHFIQEGQFLKQGKNPGKFGPPPNPFSFGELPMMKSANPVARFSHLAIAVDASAMPDRLQGKLLSIDPLHHKMIASDRTPAGSTFITSDLGFPLRSTDKTFRPVYLTGAPCGGVIIADFREEYIAHGQNYQGQIDPGSGRIYRLRGKDLPLVKDRDLASKSSSELVALLAHDNLWHRQTAARLLGQRADSNSIAPLKLLLKQGGTHPAVEALWALHQMGEFDEKTAMETLAHSAAMVRAWTIRLRGDARKLSPRFFEKLLALAATEPDSEVRCQILSTAKRLQAKQGLPLAKAIAKQSQDASDTFIPLMAWWVIEAHCVSGRKEVFGMLEDDPGFWAAPLVRQHLVPRLMRRYAEAGSPHELLACARLLELAPTGDDRAALRAGFEAAFAGRIVPELPIELASKLGKLSLSARIRSGEAEALAEGLLLLPDPNVEATQRLAIARAFGTKHHDDAIAMLLRIALDSAASPDLRRVAFSSLQIDPKPSIGMEITKSYQTLPSELKPAALNLLASRAVWTRALLKAHGAKKIPAADFDSALLARLALHTDEEVTALLARNFPNSESPQPGANADAIREILADRRGDPYTGEAIFMARCASCHKLFFKGHAFGPDLTRYQRDDLSTMLISIIDPNAEIREGYQHLVVTTRDGRIHSGFLAGENPDSIFIRNGADDTSVVIPRETIKSTRPSGRSLMPEGLLDGLSDKELRDLFAYLRISQPISK